VVVAAVNQVEVEPEEELEEVTSEAHKEITITTEV
jgi:hypothetical protein